MPFKFFVTDLRESLYPVKRLFRITIEEIEFDDAETKELDKLAERTHKCGISWEDLKARIGLMK